MSKCGEISEICLSAVAEIWAEQEKEANLTLTGNCMYPLLRDGDSLRIIYGNTDIRIGDVTVYGEQKRYFVHRVIEWTKKEEKCYFTLKPDRYPELHKSICQDKILGKVIEVRGHNRNFRFDTLFWRFFSPFLAHYFKLFAKIGERFTICLKKLHVQDAPFARIFSTRHSIIFHVLKFICFVHSAWNRLRTHIAKKQSKEGKYEL